MSEGHEVEVAERPRSVKIHKLEGGRLVAVAAVVLYVVLFVAFNTRRVEVNFVFFSIQSQLLIAFAIIAVLSFAAGFFVHGRFSGHKSLFGQASQDRP